MGDVSEPCQITWFSYRPVEDTDHEPVSELCQTTWFSYWMCKVR